MLPAKLIGHIDTQRFRFAPPDCWELEITGWVVYPLQSIQGLDIYIGDTKANVLRTSREDLASILSDIPHAAEGGFSARVLAKYFEGLRHELRFEALLRTGEVVQSKIVLDLKAVRFEGEVQADSKDLYGSETSRLGFRRKAQSGFDAFMASQETIKFPKQGKPDLSIVLVTFNQAELTYNCLRSLQASRDIKFEIILIDNASQDRSKELFSRLGGITLVQNVENAHFISGANQGAALASSEFLLFLNNDTELDPAALQNAYTTMVKHPELGVVGAKLIRPDGRLQEAGCYLLRDGSTFGFGVSDDPSDVRYANPRLVDYCSGAFLLTRLDLFRRVGGFDPALAPAYFEDVDYCIAIHELGFDIRYEPSVQVLHAEKSSSNSVSLAEALTRKNRIIIRKKHHDFLLKKPYGPVRPKLDRLSNKIIVIDNAYPDSSQGQGFPRASALLNEVLSLGWEVVFMALNQLEPPNPGLIDPRVNYCVITSDIEFEAKLTLYAVGAKAILVSRSPNMDRFSSLVDFIPTISSDIKIIFDAEALFAGRAVLESKILDGLELTPLEQAEIFRKETKLAEKSHAVFAVSELEAKVFADNGVKGVSVLSHIARVHEHSPGFESREGILMVGPILNARTPNGDGFKWFVTEVMPRVSAATCGEIYFDHVGRFDVDGLRMYLNSNIRSLGLVQSLVPLYDRHRIFVAPMRFGAGIPLKIVEAAAHGIPIVTTSLLAKQLGWRHERELLVADSPEAFCESCLKLLNGRPLWESLVAAARLRVNAEYSLDRFHSMFLRVFNSLNLLVN